MPRNREQNEQMRTQSRKQILDVARRSFAQRGYFRVKMADIARDAGMSARRLEDGLPEWRRAGLPVESD